MPKRNLRVLKWIGVVPAIATCTLCKREFKVPSTALKRLPEAQENLKLQFAEHECTSDARTANQGKTSA
jgi:hypothetical protein